MKKFLGILFIALLLTAALGACGPKEAGEELMATPTPTAAPTPTATPEPTPEPTATPEPTPEPAARELTGEMAVTAGDGSAVNRLLDGDRLTYGSYTGGAVLHVEVPEPAYSVYLEWNAPPEPYTVCWEDGSLAGGENEFLHEFLEFGQGVTSFDIVFSGSGQLCTLRVFGEGALPEDLQVWQPAWETADVLVFSSHADDDVIFFGALIADCVDRGLAVQVCYLVQHYGWPPRPHELLDALWCMGVRHYPVIGPFPDHYVLSLEEAVASFGEEAVIQYQTELLRRFRPQVVVTHDRQGEYGHGAHRLSALAMEQAVLLAADPSYDPATAELYGVWDTPKLYLHMAEESPLVLDVDRPLAAFGGKTAFEVAWEAMMYHQSQLQYAHRPQKESQEFPRYDCRRFGLVRSTVGEDTAGDIMENVTPHGAA